MLAKRKHEREKHRKRVVDLTNMKQITIIANKAEELGLSYGEYVARYGK